MNIFGKRQRSDLPFSRKSDRMNGEKRTFITHEQNIICSQTQMDDIAYEQAIIYRQLFAAHAVDSQLMKRKKSFI